MGLQAYGRSSLHTGNFGIHVHSLVHDRIYLTVFVSNLQDVQIYLRFTIYPLKLKFVKKTLNIIDMMTILPFYMELCLPHLGIESHFKEFTGELPKTLVGMSACNARAPKFQRKG